MSSPRDATLTVEEQAELDKKKQALHLANEEYLREHPELNTLLKGFMAALLDKKPEDVVAFAVKHFGGR